MLSSFFNTIILLGALQGGIISSLLFFGKKRNLANRLLGSLIFLIALACSDIYFSNQKWYVSNSAFQIADAILPLILVMPMGPLLYFYVQASLNPDFKLTKSSRLHFYPVIVDLIPKLFAACLIIGALLRFYHHLPFYPGVWIDNYNVYADIPRWLSLSIYVLFSRRYLSDAYKQNLPVAMQDQLKWLKQCVNVFGAFQLLWLMFLVPYVIPAVGDRLLSLVDWYPIYVPLAILIYWLGIKGYLIAQAQRMTDKSSANISTIFSTEAVNGFAETIIWSMEHDKLYLDPDLNLNTLAKHTGIASKTISAVLNQHLHKSFNEFINYYRVSTFKEKILSEGFDHLTIAGIASECGFNSQATFQRTFKQIAGVSPTEFRKSVLNPA